MKQARQQQGGFTLIEILTVAAIVGILGAIAVAAYLKYTEKARGADIVVKYDAIRTNVLAKTASAQGTEEDCAKLAAAFGTANLADEYATLAYGFEAVQDGFRPVLTVCAKPDPNVQGVKASRGASETLMTNGVVEQGAVISDSVVSFALRLTQDDRPHCKNWTAPAVDAACGAKPAVPTQVAAVPKSQADCAPHQHFVAGMGCNNVCNPGMYFVEGPPATCSPTPPPAQQPSGTPSTNPPAQAPVAATTLNCPAGQRPNGGNTQCVPDNTQQSGGPAAWPAPGTSTTPNAPQPTRRVSRFDYSTQREVLRSDQYWLGELFLKSPDGSPMQIVAVTITPPSFASVVGGPGNWGFKFVDPLARGEGTATFVVQNGAGLTTVSLGIRKSP